MTRWTRRGRGSYVAEISGVRVAIVNMKGDGPNAPRWRGVVPSWQIRVGGSGEHDIGSRDVGEDWTFGDAKRSVERLRVAGRLTDSGDSGDNRLGRKGHK